VFSHIFGALKMKTAVRVFSLLFAILSLALYSAAQVETGTLSGTVTDPSGAVVANATVTATNTGTGLVRSVKTGSNGTYTIVDLPPATYEVSVASANFETYKRSVAVNVGGRTTVDAALQVGSQSTVVEVSAEGGGVQVNTQDQQISNTVTSTQITELPSLTRNPYDFVLIGGNVAGDSNGATKANGVGVSLNGQRSASTEITLDGNQNVNLFGASIGQQVPLDSVQEYKVITSDFSAQYGRASGGVVNVVTKSGTNQYHGSLYEFNRVSDLASSTYNEAANNFAFRNGIDGITSPIPADHFTRNQFGYSVGGPVLPKFKDKLFFFSSTEWERIRSTGTQTADVLTPQFLAMTAPATQTYFNTFGKVLNATPTGQTLTYSQLVPPGPKSFFSPTTAAQLGNTPIFQTVNYSVPFDSGAGSPQNSWFTNNRIDWNASEKTTVFGRYAYQTVDLFPGFTSASPYAGYNTGEVDHNHNVLLSATHIFSPTILNAAKVSYERLFDFQPLNGPPGPTLYFDSSATTSFAAGTQIAFPGYTQYTPGNGIPFGGPQNLYEFDDDLSWSLGNHTLRMGGQYIHIRDNRLFGAYENPVQVAGATSNADSGVQGLLQGFLFNQAASFQGAVFPQGKFPCPGTFGPSGVTRVVTPACEVTTPVGPPNFERNNRFNDASVYFEDDWKFSPKLTLNLGIRWEYYGPQHNANPAVESNFYLANGPNFLQDVRNGQVLTTPNSPTGGLYSADYHDFAPRVGFAYDPFGNGKWAIRGGYGIAYERNFGNVTYNVIQNPPNYAVISIISQCPTPAPAGCTAKSGNAGGLVPIQTSVAGPLAGSGATVALPPVSLRAVDPHIKTAYAHLYSFAVEHEILTNTVAALEFSGSRGIHEYGIVNVNKPGLGSVLGDADPNNPVNAQYGNINFRDSVGDSYYNAVNARLQSTNFAKQGLTMTANYTWSHALDDLSSTFSQSNSNFNLGFTNPLDPGQDRGNSDYDIPNRFVFSGIWDPPFLAFKNSSKLVQTVFGGFEFAPIFTVQSGSPFNIYDCTNGSQACPNIIPAPGLTYSGTPQAIPGAVNSFSYIPIPAASANPYVNPATQLSDIPTCNASGQCLIGHGVEKDQFRAPRDRFLDLGVYKNFSISERVKLQLRGEFYNILNHHNQYVVVGTADIAQESLVTTVKGSPGGIPGSNDERRNVQLGLKIAF
jgi:outer membrane receptor protein involved in Fe transport